MHRPFDTINGEKVDFNNPDHVKVILDRNKRLEYFASNEFEIEELNPKTFIRIEIECPSCGTTIEMENNIESEELDDPISDHISDFKCGCCQTKIYLPDLFYSGMRLKTFQQQKKAKKVK